MSSPTSPFKAGQALKNVKYWQYLADKIIELGGFVQPIALDAIKEGALNLQHKTCFNKNPKNVIFRGSTYENQADLVKAVVKNGSSIEKYALEVEKEITDLLSSEAVVKLTPDQEKDTDRVFSPVLWHRKLNPNGTLKKGRLVFHDKYNSCYTKPQFRLNQAKQELSNLADVEELWKGDLTKAYYGGDE